MKSIFKLQRKIIDKNLLRTTAGILLAAAILFIFLSLLMDNTVARNSSGELFSIQEISNFENGYSDIENKRYQLFLRSKWIIGPSGTKPRLLNTDKADFSQMKQSLFIDNFLRNKTKGFFVEAGAHDGEEFSNTLYLELQRKWTGLLVEANGERFMDILARRRNAYYSNTCLSATNSSGRTRFLMAGEVGGISDHVSTQNDVNTRDKEEKNRLTYESTVQCFPLHALLSAIGRTTVDYFSLDVEGAEMAILKSIPFHQLDIRLISIEFGRQSKHHAAQNLQNFREFFAKIGGYKEVGVIGWDGILKGFLGTWGLDVFFAKT